MKRPRRRTLREEERRLWASVARTAAPMPGRSHAEVAEPAALPAAEPPPPVAAAAPPPAPGPAPPSPPRGAAKPVAARPPPLHPIERPVRRKLASGRLPIDARLDLHDMTEHLAHGALLGFLRRAAAEGLRHVLVITGRGATPGSRGALKRALPHWFATPEFRALVAGFEAAARSHGGEGAVYVRLRRRR